VAGVLLLGGCGAAEVAQQQLEQAVDTVGASARAQAQDLLNEALTSLPGEQLEVSEANRAAFQDLRMDLEQVNNQVLALLAAPQDLTQAALAPLQDQLAALQASVQQQAAELTGITVAEQQAWATLAESVQTTANQLESLAALLG
jgi:DNA mismatch repair ATPase MutL